MAEQEKRVPRAYRDAAGRAPKSVEPGQTVARIDGDETVVFLIGMRVNRWRKVRTWWPVFVAMPKMLRELQQHPEVGLLGVRTFWSGRVFMTVQYWRSLEDLGRYARDPELGHAPAWGAFNRAAAGTGDVGIFHETYRIAAENAESLYGNMPRFGLALAHASVPRAARPGRTKTHERMGSTEPEYVSAG